MGLDDPLDWLPAVPVALASVLWALYGAALSTPTLAITSTALSLCLALALQFHGHRRSRFLSARLIGQAIPVNNNNKDDKIDQPSTSKDNSLTQVSAHQQQQQQQRQTASARKEVDVDVVKTQLTNDNKSTPEELSMDDAIPSRSSSRSSSSSSRSSSSRSSVTGAPLQAVEPQQCKPLSDQWDHVVVGEGREVIYVFRVRA
ncbi:MAG: hypothetical protein BYD32DRAFT_61219 [Podila humilis]|nr:MAG: hypothetical protein BYD32DRAFT_61219 [Podila humilis]